MVGAALAFHRAVVLGTAKTAADGLTEIHFLEFQSMHEDTLLNRMKLFWEWLKRFPLHEYVMRPLALENSQTLVRRCSDPYYLAASASETSRSPFVLLLPARVSSCWGFSDSDQSGEEEELSNETDFITLVFYDLIQKQAGYAGLISGSCKTFQEAVEKVIESREKLH